MQFNNNQKSKMHLIGALGLLFSLVSCGSYQYAGYDDGIYGTSERNVEYYTESSNEVPSSQNSNYYQNYFKEKSQELDYLSQDDVIFTDIDSYESDYEVGNDTLVDTQAFYAGWGQNSTEVSINVYNSGYLFNNWWYRPFYYSYGYGFYNHWYNPYRFYGYSNWYNPYGYYGFYNWHYPYYGSYYSNYGYYGNYYNNYYSRRGIAYNAGRRGAIYQNSYTSRLSNRALTSTRNSTTYRPRRASNSNVSTRTEVTRPRTTTRRNLNNRTRVNSNNRARVNSNNGARTNTRSYSPTRSSTRSYTPSRSSSRSNYSPSRSSSRSSGSSTSRRRGGSGSI